MRIILFFVLLFPAALMAESYWQQDVHYIIDAKLDPDKAVVTGKETLVYTNNSPDTLKVAYFRLYWNAFTERSHGEEFALREKQYRWNTTGGTTVKKITFIKGATETIPVYTIDNTVMEVQFPSALPPGDSVKFYFEWEGKVLEGGIRTGHEGRDFDIAQWYPQIAVYDKFGWDKNQYLTQGEFHNEYGTFDVSITLPKSFLLGYTGQIVNPEEVYPDSVRAKLKESMGNDSTVQIADYSETDWKGADTVLQTWKFRAEHVTDFAWSANEHYIWDVAHWTPPEPPEAGMGAKSITIHSLYFADKKEYWREVAHFGRHAISFFSTHYGQYTYPNMFIIEGVEGGGMEYPGLTFCGHYGDKNNHGLYGVTVHETGHNWYPMMIQSNETYFAFMDEGFNTFITTTAEEDYYGRHDNSYTWTDWQQKFFHYDNDDSRQGNQRGALDLAKTGYEEPVATHCYRFKQQALSGSSIYPKTASIILMLQYVLGDSVFSHVMKEYYRKYHFKHVYPEDFYNNAMEASGQKDLRWFFDEWFNRTYTCDYGVCGLRSEKLVENNQTRYRTRFTIHRYGQAIMPLDIRISMVDGSSRTVLMPVDQWFNGEEERDTVVDLSSYPDKAEINPDGRILDINRLNNVTGIIPPTKIEFDNTMFHGTPIDSYLVLWRPSFWYTDAGGMQIGAKVNGNYLRDMYRLNLGGWYNTADQTMNYDLGVGQNTFMITPLSNINARLWRLEGRKGVDVDISKGIRDEFYVPPQHMFTARYSYSRADNTDYLLLPSTWEQGNLQRMIFGYSYYNRGDQWNVSAGMNFETSVGLFKESDWIYAKRTVDLRGTLQQIAGFDLSLRLYDGLGYGDIPNQAKYYIAEGNPLDQMSAPFLRSKGPLPTGIRDHALYPGGGFMRGYYNFTALGGGMGTKIEAVNSEAKFYSLIPFWNRSIPLISSIPVLGDVRSALFFDAGRITSDPYNLWDQKFEVDCGFGFRLTNLTRYFGPFSDTNLLNSVGLNMIRFDFPIYVSMPAPGEDKLRFRWVVELNEMF
ncbi:MAG: M1 family metallopeptidase [Bacteroidota bacterium]